MEFVLYSPDSRWGAIPIAYGWNAFYAAGVFAADTVYGKTPLSVTLKRITQTAFEAFSPVGGSGFDLTKVASDPVKQVAAVITPTILMPLLQWYTNVNRWGSPITPDSKAGKREGYSDTTKAFGSVNPISKDFAVWLQQPTGCNRANKEGIDSNPALIDYLVQAYTPGLASELYKVAGNEVRTSRGLTIPREKELLEDRFSAYASDSSDAQAFRRVSEKAGALFQELKVKPPSDPRAVKIRREYPGLADAMDAIQITNKELDTLRSAGAKVELDAYQYRHAGKIKEADAKDRAVVEFQNKEKATEKRIYGVATKAFIKAGFEPLVVFGD